LNFSIRPVRGDGQPFQDVSPGFGLLQVVPGPPPDDVLAVGDEILHHVDQAEYLGLLVDDGQHDDAEGGLQLGVLVEVVQNDLGQLTPLDLDHDPDAFPVGLVADVGDALDLLGVDQLGDALQEPRLVDGVGDLGDDDPLPLTLVAPLDHRLGPDLDAAAAGAVGVPQALPVEDVAPGREVRAGENLHDLVQRGVGVLDQVRHGVADLGQVVGRDVGGHAHGDARAAVDQQVREPGRQDLGHGQALVVVRDKVDRVLLDVGQHLRGQPAHTDFGVAHGRRRVAVDTPEVALAVDQDGPHAELLGHPDDRVVRRLVAVGVVLADDVADDAGRLLVGLVVGRPRLVHGVQAAPVDGLEAVLDVRDGPADDDGHGVVEVGALHLLLEADDREVGGHREQSLLGLGGLFLFGPGRCFGCRAFLGGGAGLGLSGAVGFLCHDGCLSGMTRVRCPGSGPGGRWPR
jgi:hypothetical protein